MAAGVAYVPEDRGGEAVFLDQTLAENLTAALIPSYWRRGLLRHRAVNDDARGAIKKFLISASSEQQEMGTLSGGNQQKVIVARWLRRNPRILLLDEPSHGVDVNARAEIYAIIKDAVLGGCSVLLVTSDFEELAHVSDRVVVLAGGRITAELRSPDIDPTRLTELAYTITQEAS
jgi:ribose transport system ATP-binding protein